MIDSVEGCRDVDTDERHYFLAYGMKRQQTQRQSKAGNDIYQ